MQHFIGIYVLIKTGGFIMVDLIVATIILVISSLNEHISEQEKNKDYPVIFDTDDGDGEDSD